MTQNDRLKVYLEIHGKITPIEALSRLGIYRLSARVHDLKQRGMDIETRVVTVPMRNGRTAAVAEYYIAPRQKKLW